MNLAGQSLEKVEPAVGAAAHERTGDGEEGPIPDDGQIFPASGKASFIGESAPGPAKGAEHECVKLPQTGPITFNDGVTGKRGGRIAAAGQLQSLPLQRVSAGDDTPPVRKGRQQTQDRGFCRGKPLRLGLPAVKSIAKPAA